MARKSKVPSFRSMGQQDKNAVIYTVLTRPYVREYRAFRVALAGQGVVGALDLSAPQAARLRYAAYRHLGIDVTPGIMSVYGALGMRKFGEALKSLPYEGATAAMDKLGEDHYRFLRDKDKDKYAVRGWFSFGTGLFTTEGDIERKARKITLEEALARTAEPAPPAPALAPITLQSARPGLLDAARALVAAMEREGVSHFAVDLGKIRVIGNGPGLFTD